MKRAPLVRRPRSKGNRGELEVIEILHDFGWTRARRNWQSGGQGGGDVVEGPADVSIEVKRCETASLFKWLDQCQAAASPTEIPLLAFRRSRSPWWGCLPEDELDALLQLASAPTFAALERRGFRRIQVWPTLDAAVALANAARAGIPVVRLQRAGDEQPWSVAPLFDVLRLIRVRETA